MTGFATCAASATACAHRATLDLYCFCKGAFYVTMGPLGGRAMPVRLIRANVSHYDNGAEENKSARTKKQRICCKFNSRLNAIAFGILDHLDALGKSPTQGINI